MLNKEQFLNELTELSEKYSIIIGGCGCCGSPFLMTFDDRDDPHPFNLPGGKYACNDEYEEDSIEWENAPEDQAEAQKRLEAAVVAAREKAAVNARELREAREKLRLALDGERADA